MENVWIAALGMVFIFFMTAMGAAVVYFFRKEIPVKLNAVFFGFASGVMIAASVWSLLLPAIEQAQAKWGTVSLIGVVLGVVIGGATLAFLDKRISILQKTNTDNQKAKMFRVFIAVTLHNIPEGLAVGFAFGAASLLGTPAAYFSALGLAIGIGIQNFPEGAAISLSVKNAVKSNTNAFLWGAGSGVVEPFFAIIGYFLAAKISVLQPWLLSFSAGAMLFVSAQDLIPDSRLPSSPRLGAWGVLLGFVLMMTLDVLLG